MKKNINKTIKEFENYLRELIIYFGKEYKLKANCRKGIDELFFDIALGYSNKKNDINLIKFELVNTILNDYLNMFSNLIICPNCKNDKCSIYNFAIDDYFCVNCSKFFKEFKNGK